MRVLSSANNRRRVLSLANSPAPKCRRFAPIMAGASRSEGGEAPRQQCKCRGVGTAESCAGASAARCRFVGPSGASGPNLESSWSRGERGVDLPSVMPRTFFPSCLLIVLLGAGLMFPAAAGAGCCPVEGLVGGAGGHVSEHADEAGAADAAACGSCCGDGAESRSPEDPADPDQPEKPGDDGERPGERSDRCDCLRSCCGAVQPVVTARPAETIAHHAPAGLLRTPVIGSLPREAGVDLLRPPQL